MRLLDIAQSYPSDDPSDIAGIFIHRQFLALKQKGWDIRVITPQPLLYREAKGLGHYYPFRSVRDDLTIWRPRYLWVPGLMSPNSGIQLERIVFSAVDRAFKQIQQNNWNPDLIVGDWLVPVGYAVSQLAQKVGVPYVLRARGHDVLLLLDALKVPKLKQYYRTMLDRASLILCQGEGIYEDLCRVDIIDRAKLLPVSNGINTDIFHPVSVLERQTLRNKLNIPQDAQVWLFVGLWAEHKGIEEMVQVIPNLLKEHPNIHFIAVGPVKDQASQVVIAAQSPQIRFVGMLNTEQVAEWLNAADVFLLPSHREGLPNALLEAMASGLVCVASGVNGIPFVVTNNVNGILIQPRTPASLHAALERCANDFESVRPLGEAGRKTIFEKGYDLKSVAEYIHRLFIESLNLPTP